MTYLVQRKVVLTDYVKREMSEYLYEYLFKSFGLHVSYLTFSRKFYLHQNFNF